MKRHRNVKTAAFISYNMAIENRREAFRSHGHAVVGQLGYQFPSTIRCAYLIIEKADGAIAIFDEDIQLMPNIAAMMEEARPDASFDDRGRRRNARAIEGSCLHNNRSRPILRTAALLRKIRENILPAPLHFNMPIIIGEENHHTIRIYFAYAMKISSRDEMMRIAI